MEAVEHEGVKDASHLYEVERRARHAERPGFRVSELQIGPRQQVPWHYHSNIQDTFYVLQGRLRLFLRDTAEAPAVRAQFQRILGPDAPLLLLEGDICRNDLRVEIEGLFQAAAP